MPCRPRIKLAELPQHIVQRCQPESLPRSRRGLSLLPHWLMKSAASWRCAIHAYVLMTNHVHLLVTPEIPDGPRGPMQSIERRYGQYINRNYKRGGSFWIWF